MKIFRFNKPPDNTKKQNLPCPKCGSKNTGTIVDGDSSQADYVKVWRGKKYFSWKCRDCGHDFYGEAPTENEPQNNDLYLEPIDKAALKAAENELKKQADEDDDHLCR
ncbi:MAG TPA: hypothetical protein VEH58_07550 [Dehalococcoidales bacterium]|nr:hypothetical protein [Dehalococcoidales bacterium]